MKINKIKKNIPINNENIINDTEFNLTKEYSIEYENHSYNKY